MKPRGLADAVYLISSVFKSIFLNTGWILSAKKNLDYILAQIRILLNWKITRSSGFTFVVFEYFVISRPQPPQDFSSTNSTTTEQIANLNTMNRDNSENITMEINPKDKIFH